MKKTYETPNVEVVKFQYRDQVVVASNGGLTTCQVTYSDHPSDAVNCKPIGWQYDHGQ